MISSFTCVVILLVVIIVVILCRRRLCQREKDGRKGGAVAAAATNNLIAAANNGGDHRFPPDQATSLKQDLETPSFSNEADSAWEGSDDNNQDCGGFIRANGHPPLTQVMLKESEPDFPPKPVSSRRDGSGRVARKKKSLWFQDVITTGYVPYGTYVRDFSPPCNGGGGGGGDGSGRNSPMYNSGGVSPPPPPQSSLLNVSDPRFSATYGNPFLKQVKKERKKEKEYRIGIVVELSFCSKSQITPLCQTGPNSMHYSTFLPPAPAASLAPSSSSTFVNNPVSTNTVSSLGAGSLVAMPSLYGRASSMSANCQMLVSACSCLAQYHMSQMSDL